MSTRAQKIAAHIDAFATKHPLGFVVGLFLCVLGTVSAVGLSISVLLAGPIGPELLAPYLSSGIARISVLQFATFTALLLAMVFVVCVASWQNAPRWLQWLCFSSILCRLGSYIQGGLKPGSAHMYWLLVGGVGILVNYAMLWDLPMIACLEPDTVGYLKPSALRSAGYMFFIDTVVMMSGDLRWLMPVQLNLMLISFMALGWSVRHSMGSFGAGLIVATVPMVSAGLLVLAPAVMSEALFVALICFHVAAVIYAMRDPGWWALGVAGLTLGLLIVVRPNGISFLVGIGLLLYLLRPYWRRVLIACIVPVCLIVGAQGIYNLASFGFFGLHKFGGISLAANFSPLIRANMGGEYAPLNEHLEQRLSFYSRDFPDFERRDYPYEMARVASIITVGAIYKEILPAIRAHLGLKEPEAVALEYDPRINDIAGQLAKAAVLNDPWGAVKIITSNYIANWHTTLPVRVPMSIYYPRCLSQSREVAAQHGELLKPMMNAASYHAPVLEQRMGAIQNQGLRAIEYPRLLISAMQLPLAYLALIISWLGLVRLVFKKHAEIQHSGIWLFAALTLQAGYGLISVGNASFTRYTVVFDPIVVLMLIGAGVVGLRYLYSAPKP